MTDIRQLTSAQATIFTALAEAATDTSLRICLHGDLTGASVVGASVEAYVIAVSKGGFQVDLWRDEAANPFRTVRQEDLAAAVALAVRAALRSRRSP
ncbi:hypothetical protein ACFQY4_15065 [Catellatospora bangladeshensis]|uniref:Uncharacterized protein n=1 Tax=Catellatospora bangladeshensis TaxID=310355 RepID=A0A8J3JQA1_9ACTN|nr:hypothetical protein [Catellatospora bangladeshensis]GIF83070.1 hypothetical protein Cba03nite_44190 [Catellatospora bangladeshensis]